MKPIEKVTVELVKGHIQERVYGSRFQHGYTVAESVLFQTGGSLGTFRKNAAKKAKLLGVPFEDRIKV